MYTPNNPRNHFYVVGFYVGQLETLRHMQELLNTARFYCDADQALQLELDREQTVLDKHFERIGEAMDRIQSSN